MTEITQYQKRYKYRNPIPHEAEAREWIKMHKPDLYARLLQDDACQQIIEQSPEFQAREREAEEQFEAELRSSSDYQLLGLDAVEGTLTKREVKNAYRRKSRRVHPDAGGSEDAFKALHAAYRRVLAMVPA